jgi:hypothetical protein
VEYVSASNPLNQNVALNPNAIAPTKDAPYTDNASESDSIGFLRRFWITITPNRYSIETVIAEANTLTILPRHPRLPKGMIV